MLARLLSIRVVFYSCVIILAQKLYNCLGLIGTKYHKIYRCYNCLGLIGIKYHKIYRCYNVRRYKEVQNNLQDIYHPLFLLPFRVMSVV